MKILIVGGGRSVYFLSRSFMSKGHSVVVINKDADECVQLVRRLDAKVVHGDGTDPAVLEEAGARGADALIAITPFDHDNLVACQLAQGEYGVPKSLALVDDPDNQEVFEHLGVDTFSTTGTLVTLLEQRTIVDDVRNLMPLDEGRVNVTEVEIDADSPVLGMNVRDLGFPDDALMAVILRGDTPMIPSGATSIEMDDRVVLVTTADNHDRVLKLVTGETT